jgi:hypothetical protein
LVDRLTSECPGVTAGWTPSRADDAWLELGTKLRLSLDYLRYLEPAYRDATRVRERAAERTPRGLLWGLSLPGLGGRLGRRLWGSGLRRLEAAVPRSAEVEAYLREQAPDVVLLTPLIGLGSPEQDYLIASKALGLRTMLCVWSWDNLSSKSLIRQWPDRVAVWNDTQREEAVRLHGVPSERVVVTGAQCFDQWFDRAPSRDREAFCAHVGLRDARPFLLYVCSALFRGSPSEAAFVREWIETLRARGDATLRDANILVRPHPSRMKEWESVTVRDLPGVAFWGGNPVDRETKADYFDSLYHASAIAGLNTSAFLEGAIVGRPVLTWLRPEFRENQEGTLHFHYLLTVNGGLLHVARNEAGHLGQMSAALRGDEEMAARSRRFIAAFIRPHGLERSGTTVFVEAVEALAAAPAPAPATESAGWLWRAALQRLARLSVNPRTRPMFVDPREAEKAARRAARIEADRRGKDERRQARLKAAEEKERRRAAQQVEAMSKADQLKEQREREKEARVQEKRRRLRAQRRAELRSQLKRKVKGLVGHSS